MAGFIDGVIKNWAVWTTIIMIVFTFGVNASKITAMECAISKLEDGRQKNLNAIVDYKTEFAVINVKLERMSIDIKDIKDSLKEHADIELVVSSLVKE